MGDVALLRWAPQDHLSEAARGKPLEGCVSDGQAERNENSKLHPSANMCTKTMIVFYFGGWKFSKQIRYLQETLCYLQQNKGAKTSFGRGLLSFKCSLWDFMILLLDFPLVSYELFYRAVREQAEWSRSRGPEMRARLIFYFMILSFMLTEMCTPGERSIRESFNDSSFEFSHTCRPKLASFL